MRGATEYAMHRNIKRLLHLLSLMPWWGIVFAGVAGYVIWRLASYSIARSDPHALTIQSTDSLAAFWLAFCLGAGLFQAVCALLDRLRVGVMQRTVSGSNHWEGGRR